MSWSGAAVLGGLTLLLAGCQALPTTTEGESPAFRARVGALQSLADWQVDGRIAFRYQGDGGTGAMTWLQEGEYLEFSFRGPLGASSFILTGRPQALRLETGEGEPQLLSDPERELRARFGFSAPFDHLRFWMLGAPHPAGSPAVRVDEQGLLRELRQDGWLVTYDRYHNGEPRLPRKLTILREDVRIRVIVDYWHFSADEA